MRTFEDFKSYEEVKELAKEKQWGFDDREFQKGGDAVSVTMYDNYGYIVLYNVTNGRFIVIDPVNGDIVATHASDTFEHKGWYNYILDNLYKEEN